MFYPGDGDPLIDEGPTLSSKAKNTPRKRKKNTSGTLRKKRVSAASRSRKKIAATKGRKKKAPVVKKPKRKKRSLTAGSKFENLKRALTQRDTKVVLSLGGGGIRMFAHAAVLRLLETLNLQSQVDEIWGASGGAVVGFLYSQGMSPKEIEDFGRELVKEKHITLMPSYLTIFKRIISDRFFSQLRNNYTLRGFQDFHDKLYEFAREIVSKGKGNYPVYCLAYNVASDQTDVLTPQPIPHNYYPGWIYHEDPLESVLASCCVPIIYIPRVLNGSGRKRVYVDGAIVEDVPSTSIYKKWLRDKELGIEKRKRLLVIAVNLNPYFRSMGFLENWALKRLPGFEYLLLSAHYGDVMRRARTKAQKKMLTSDPSVELWDLSLEMPPGGIMNINLIPKVIQTANRTLPRQLARIDKSLLG